MNRDVQHHLTNIVDKLTPEEIPDFFSALWTTLKDKQQQYNGTPQNQIVTRAVIGCGRVAIETAEVALTQAANQFAQAPTSEYRTPSLTR